MKREVAPPVAVHHVVVHALTQPSRAHRPWGVGWCGTQQMEGTDRWELGDESQLVYCIGSCKVANRLPPSVRTSLPPSVCLSVCLLDRLTEAPGISFQPFHHTFSSSTKTPSLWPVPSVVCPCPPNRELIAEKRSEVRMTTTNEQRQAWQEKTKQLRIDQNTLQEDRLWVANRLTQVIESKVPWICGHSTWR